MNPLLVQGAAQLLLGKYKTQKGMFMKNMLTMAATGLVIFASLGWYLDWYKVNRTATPDGRQHITIDLNTKRIGSDIERGKAQVTGYLNNGGIPSPAAPTPYTGQPTGQLNYGQPYFPPQQGSQPVYQGQPTAPGGYYPPAGYQPPPQPGWVPATPTARPSAGGFVFPGTSNPPPPPSGIPGRPF